MSKLFTVTIAAAMLVMASQVSACADIRPAEKSANTITLSFYQNKSNPSASLGTVGADCPIACDSTTFIEKNTFYEKSKMPSGVTCTTWPGRSGENSMNNGTVDLAANKFSIDQRITCDCSGTITTKDSFTTKCVIDNPTKMCAKITYWDTSVWAFSGTPFVQEGSGSSGSASLYSSTNAFGSVVFVFFAVLATFM